MRFGNQSANSGEIFGSGMTERQSANVAHIWSAWIQGRESAPASVRAIFELWEDLHPTSKVHILERQEIFDIIADLGIDPHPLTPQVASDIIRTYLLSKHGGVWVDATLLPVVPLQDWLTKELTMSGFFAFRSSGHPLLVLHNWFLYSEPSCTLTVRWLELFCEYFQRRRYQYPSKRALFSPYAPDIIKAHRAILRKDFLYFVDSEKGRNCRIYPYAIHNFTLAHLLENDEEVRSIWQSVPEVFGVAPSLIGRCAADRDTVVSTFESLFFRLLSCAPIHKLNHQDGRFASLIKSARKMELIRP